MEDDALRGYLDTVEGNLRGPGKADILREIESHILDEAEALAAARGGEIEPQDVRRAIADLGDPSDLAVSYSSERYLIGPKEYAGFWYFTGLLFAVHLAMLLIAAATASQFGFFPFNVLPPTGPAGALTLFSLAVQAFLFDAGLVCMLFFLLGRTFRRVDLPNLTFRVESSRGPSLRRVVFVILVGILLGAPAVRDKLFIVRAPVDGKVDWFSIFLPAFSSVLPVLLAFLGFMAAKDLLYAIRGERRLTVAMDGVAAVLGIFVSLYLLSRPPVVGLPLDFPLEREKIDSLNDGLARVLDFGFIIWAALFAARAAKRIARLRLIW